MLPCLVILRSPSLAAAITSVIRASRRSRLTRARNASLSFQRFAHSSQFKFSTISRIFLTLRTLCQKHPGVGVPPLAPLHSSLTTSLITPMESHSLPFVPCNSFRMIFFRKSRGSGGALLPSATSPPAPLRKVGHDSVIRNVSLHREFRTLLAAPSFHPLAFNLRNLLWDNSSVKPMPSALSTRFRCVRPLCVFYTSSPELVLLP
jgi:hypothetical protein